MHRIDAPGSAPAADGTASGIIRYARPAPELAEFLTGYQVFTPEPSSDSDRVDRLLPGAANVRVSLGAAPTEIRIGRRRFAPVPTVALVGPTTYAPCAIGLRGVIVGFGVTPLGWGRLFRTAASRACDRIMPLDDLIGPELPASLLAELSALGNSVEAAFGRVLDRVLAPRFASPGDDEATVRVMAALLTDPDLLNVAEFVERSGLRTSTVQRGARRYFGMPPKLLMRRARFLRSFLGYFTAGSTADYAGIDASYHDPSHFLRDAHRFLGTTPKRFAAEATALLDQSLAARTRALGASTCVLHEAAGPDPFRADAVA